MDIVLKDDRFNTVILKKYTFSPLNNDLTIKILLSYYLNMACKDYNTEASFDRYLGSNYDLNYTVSVNNIGLTSIMEFQLIGVNPILINDESYTIESLINSFNVVTTPVIKENCFDLDLFNKAKENYINNLLYNNDVNKQGISITNTINNYFKGTKRCFLPDGDLNILKDITVTDLYNYYLETLNDEHISYIAGNIDLVGENNFKLRPKNNNFFRERLKVTNQYEEVKLNTKQCYLNIIYDLNIYPDNSLYYAATMLNHHFGGSTSSLLFNIIREKYGLCYSISSTYYGASGMILVSAIINKRDEARVIELVDECFNEILNNFLIDEYKKHFRLSVRAKRESLNTKITDHLIDNFFPELIPSYLDLKMIQSTNMLDVSNVHKKMKKSYIYSYGGNKK